MEQNLWLSNANVSNSASFWAAKSDVKSPTTPESVDLLRTTPQEPPKNAVGAKDDTKKSNWADSDDDEEFLASFTDTSHIQELEKTVIAKDARIIDMDNALQEKDGRIAELEDVVERQQRGLDKMNISTDVLSTQVEGLKTEAHKQLFHVQELITEIEKKDRRIAVLEIDLDRLCDTIVGLDVEQASKQASSHETSMVVDEEVTKEKDSEKEAQSTKTEDAPTKPVVQNNDKGTFVLDADSPEPKATFPGAAGSVVDLSGFPVFVTPATIKQTAPPPPAPKLKMGIDLSKFAKKTSSKTPIIPKAKSGSGTSKHDKWDSPAPKIDSSSDVRTKSYEERVLFANGPKVEVKMGGVSLPAVPKYILMQCSSKAFKHFTESPEVTTFTLPANSMDFDAAAAHLGWMKEMTYKGRAYSITLNSDEKFDDKNLQICRAARVLGLNNMYVGHFTKIFCDRIRSDAASYEFLSKVAAAAYPENDPIYDCLTNNLANLRTRTTVKEPAKLKELLDAYPGLKTCVEKIGERMHKKQRGAKGENNTKVVHVDKKMFV
ncbi:uncharacterized protein EKO05_0003254 [Ascochyta rabiei]|nr:uncharacterized protein EKO05_0003254 [Ascochyta rabiei]UPX12715.1 hypothetical protein EKO05_0003254 [Ascochyta rabiei]